MNNPMKLITILFLFSNSLFADDISFTIQDGNTTGIKQILEDWKAEETQLQGGTLGYWWLWGAKAADLDGDKRPEIIINSHTYRGIILKNTDGVWRDATKEFGFTSHRDFVPGEFKPIIFDFDGDGDLDIMPSSQAKLKLLINNGTFTKGEWNDPVNSRYAQVIDRDVISFASGWGVTNKYTFKSVGESFELTSEKATRPVLPDSINQELDALELDKTTGNRYAGPKFWEGGNLKIVSYFGSYADPAHRFGRYVVDGERKDIIPTSSVPLLPPVDVNGDGLLDIFTVASSTAGLYLQQADGTYVNSGMNSVLKANSPYLPQYHVIDFDLDGDLDILIDMLRLGYAVLYDNKDGVFTEVLRIPHWDANGLEIYDMDGNGTLDLIAGGPAPGQPFNGSIHLDANFTIYINNTEVESTVLLPVLSHPLEYADKESAEAKRFLAWAERSLTVNQYGFDAFRASLAYVISGDERFNVKAHDMVMAYVTAAEMAISSGKAPAIARDSYLHAYREVSAIIFPLFWCDFTAEEEQRALAIVTQTVSNIWNPATASWGGNLFKWSGWSINNPENNYHFSFLGATVLEALYTLDEAKLAVAKQKLERLAAAHNFKGGGSREGTGYGTAHAAMFEVFKIWELSTGETFEEMTQHALDSQGYWLHATTPDKKFIATLGDQARNSAGQIYDYHRTLTLSAGRLSGLMVEPEPPTMKDGFNFHQDMVRPEIFDEFTQSLSHKSDIGHYFARSSWENSGTYLAFRAGLRSESHMGQEMGAFDLWNGNWLTNSEISRSKSGIKQTTDWFNVVRFERSGVIVPQKFRAEASATITDDEETWVAESDMTPLYTGVIWKRIITFTRPNTVRIEDQYSGAEGIFQLQLPVEPIVEGNKTIAGKLQITVAEGEISVKDWKILSTDAVSGWRLEIRNPEKFDVTLEVIE